MFGISSVARQKLAMSTEEQNSETDHAESESPATASDEHRPVRHFKLALIALIALILFAGMILAGVVPRLSRQKKINAAAQAVQTSIPNVSVVQVQEAPASSDLQLPGDIEAIQVATISAQTTGFLHK